MQFNQAVNQVLPLYQQIASLEEDAKEMLAGFKEAGLDQAMVAKIAKAKANEKLLDLEAKANDLLAAIQQVD